MDKKIKLKRFNDFLIESQKVEEKPKVENTTESIKFPGTEETKQDDEKKFGR